MSRPVVAVSSFHAALRRTSLRHERSGPGRPTFGDFWEFLFPRIQERFAEFESLPPSDKTSEAVRIWINHDPAFGYFSVTGVAVIDDQGERVELIGFRLDPNPEIH